MIFSNKGAILILSGPSGCGKSTLLKEAYKEINNYYFSISTTTRSIREGEKDGVDYYFVSKEEFEKDIANGDFLEYANVHGNYYGTSLKAVKEALQSGKLILFDIDVQGNTAVNNRLGDITTSVFITPPTLSELKKRLESRSTDSAEVISNRLKMAKREVQRISEYDYLIINDDLKVAADVLRQIAITARIKIPTNKINKFVQEWEDIEQ